MGNSFAYFIIIMWPFFVFGLLLKYGVIFGVCLSFIISYMFLPANYEINIQGFPALNKGTATVISLLVYFIFVKGNLKFFNVGSFSKFVFLLFLLSPLLTAITNTERYLHLPGMSLYDGVSLIANNFLVIFPFFIAFKYFKDFDSQLKFFKLLLFFMLIYSMLILIEIRFSPQLHRIFYGFHPHYFIQQVREGGYRAVVFLGHGLLVALLVSIALLTSVLFYKMKRKIFGYNSIYFIIFFLLILFFSKSYGALAFGLFGMFVILLFKPAFIFYIAFLSAVVFLLYPFLSVSGLFPHQSIVDMASSINYDRGQSLAFRFYHESTLLHHAMDKPLFGWGSWGRNRIYDPVTFRDLSVTDGRWIIVLGTRGLVGFITEYYFIVLSLFLTLFLARKASYFKKEEVILMSGHALMISFILIDQVPNSSLNYFYWFFIGIYYSRIYQLLKDFKEASRGKKVA